MPTMHESVERVLLPQAYAFQINGWDIEVYTVGVVKDPLTSLHHANNLWQII